MHKWAKQLLLITIIMDVPDSCVYSTYLVMHLGLLLYLLKCMWLWQNMYMNIIKYYYYIYKAISSTSDHCTHCLSTSITWI